MVIPESRHSGDCRRKITLEKRQAEGGIDADIGDSGSPYHLPTHYRHQHDVRD
jgi:hypothetical protein